MGFLASFPSLFFYASGYPFPDVLPCQPATLPPVVPCRPLPSDPVLQVPASPLLPLPALQLPNFCYSTDDCYYHSELIGVNMVFPSCPWSSSPTLVGVTAPAYLDPTEAGLPFYPPFPILQLEDLLPPPPAWHPPAEILELSPTPLPQKSQRPAGGKAPPRKAVLLRKRVKVIPRWKSTAAVVDISATEVVGGGTVGGRPPRRRSGHGGRLTKNSWVPRLRRYWRKPAPGEEKFQFKTGGAVREELNSGGRLGGGGGDGRACHDARTTVMIKNLPNKLTKEVLFSYLSGHCREENSKLAATYRGQQQFGGQFIPSRFDFFYLPMDFGTGSNLGYAFVNFTSAVAAWRLYHAFDKKSWGFLGSNKVCEVTYARIQGLGALRKHFMNSVFECDRDELLPVCFLPYCDGTFEGRSHYVGRRVSSSSQYCWHRI